MQSSPDRAPEEQPPLLQNGENHGGASSDSADDNWSVKFSCTNTVGETEDTVTIAREYMNVSGFSLDETKTAIETWADSQNALA